VKAKVLSNKVTEEKVKKLTAKKITQITEVNSNFHEQKTVNFTDK